MTSCSFHQAILKYLRECLNDTEDGEVESSDSTDNNVFSKHTIPLQPIDNKFSLVASKSDTYVMSTVSRVMIIIIMTSQPHGYTCMAGVDAWLMQCSASSPCVFVNQALELLPLDVQITVILSRPRQSTDQAN